MKKTSIVGFIFVFGLISLAGCAHQKDIHTFEQLEISVLKYKKSDEAIVVELEVFNASGDIAPCHLSGKLIDAEGNVVAKSVDVCEVIKGVSSKHKIRTSLFFDYSGPFDDIILSLRRGNI